jgi:non-ribosomal peptide synthetase-like protein
METLDAIFQSALAAHGDRIAIDIPPRGERARIQLTYRDLEARASVIARTIDAVPGPRDDDSQSIVVMMLPRDSPDVYAAQLAASRLNCAFCCVDEAFPDWHIRSVIADAQPRAVLCHTNGVARLRELAGGHPLVDVSAAVDAGLTTTPHAASTRAPVESSGFVAAQPAHHTALAYLIYTSGTTGAPKGVMIEHASIASLVRSDMARFGLGPGDRVAQCSSNAYDSSVEETWMALAVGATLVPVDDERVRSGPDLVPWMRAERINVFCPPPTLLRAMGVEHPPSELPDLRLLYVGGEALPQDLSDLWSQHVWLENGYGPTECTVTVVRGRMQPGVPVHIGTAVDGNEAFVLDDAGEVVGHGTEGELWMRGIGLARGYRNLHETTAERFVEHATLGRIYRTGDRVRARANGDLEYLGRADGQVKLRGYRVELPAIEACLMEHPSVTHAACAVVGDGVHAKLGACVVLNSRSVTESEMLTSTLSAWVRERLPIYMVPARVRAVDAIPTLVSGKIDRRALAAALADEFQSVDPSMVQHWESVCADHTRPIEARVCAAFAASLGMSSAPAPNANFFTDLDGDSLRAVDCLLRLRRGCAVSSGVRDIYAEPTAAGLARVIHRQGFDQPPTTDGNTHQHGAKPTTDTPSNASPENRHGTALLGSIGQVLIVALGFVPSAGAAYLLLFHALPALVTSVGVAHAVWITPLALMVLAALWLPVSVFMTLATKRVLINRYHVGRVRAWSAQFVREWIVEQVSSTIPWSLIEGTELVSWTYRVLGARIGRRVHIHRGVNMRRGGWDLVEIGDGATLAQDAVVLTSHLHQGEIVHDRVRVGAGAHVGIRATLHPGCSLGVRASIEPLSVLLAGAHIPPGERWSGVPAAPTASQAELTPRLHAGWNPWTYTAVFLLVRAVLAMVGLVPPILLALVLITIDNQAVSDWIAHPEITWHAVALASVWSAASIVLWLLYAALAMRFTRGIRPGFHPRYSWTYFWIWNRTGTVEAAGRWISGTLFWPMWLRAAGMQVGRGSEVSTIIDVLPESVSIGADSFFADGVYLCCPFVHDGMVHVGHTTLGDGTFLGNHCVIPAQKRYPDGMFIGVSTIAPHDAGKDQGWFGVPPMLLHRREVVDVDRRLTHDPGFWQRVSRWSWESARCLVAAPALISGIAWVAAVETAHEASSVWWCALVWAPLASAATWLAVIIFGISAKWILLGRVQPGQHGLWSSWCSRWDYLYVLWWFSARAALLRVEGTPILNIALRATGMHIGRNVLIGPGATQIVDPDMLHFADGATVACHFQAHSFEDRILKIDRVHIGAGANAGENAVVFYGATIEPGGTLESGSVLMKRGVVPAGTVAIGAPVG